MNPDLQRRRSLETGRSPATMICRRFTPLSLLLLLLLLQLQVVLSTTAPPSLPSHHHNEDDANFPILEQVLKEIWNRRKWEGSPDGTNISKLGVTKVRLGTSRRYEFRIRFDWDTKTRWAFRFPDEVDHNSWTKPTTTTNEGRSLSQLLRETGPALLDTFRIEGPFDLWVPSDERLSLSLPMNSSRTGLKRVIVSEGITVEVSKAREVSLSQSFYSDFAVNGWVNTSYNGKIGFCPFCSSYCLPLLPIKVVGSATLVAYRTRNPDAAIWTAFLSNDTIELLPEKCYSNNESRFQARLVHSLSLRVARLERLMRGLLGDKALGNGFLGFVKVDLKASSVVRFFLELERTIGKNETREVVLAEWRTRPTVERVLFEVVARVEAEKLKPIVIKIVKPLVVVDTASWSNLMSNISFTKFPSVLVPPEALTLDVKW